MSCPAKYIAMSRTDSTPRSLWTPNMSHSSALSERRSARLASQDTKELQRRAHVGRIVPSRARPHVLIERLNSAPWRRQDHPQSIPTYELIVGQVSDDFLNGPLR